MKPLTKTVVSRGGGIAARFAPADEKAGRDRHAKVETPRPRAQSPSASLDTTPLAKPVANKRRYERWRDKNPELYKARQADYMRKKRAKDKKAAE